MWRGTNVLGNWQLAKLLQSERGEIDPHIGHEIFSTIFLSFVFYKGFPVPAHKKYTQEIRAHKHIQNRDCVKGAKWQNHQTTPQQRLTVINYLVTLLLWIIDMIFLVIRYVWKNIILWNNIFPGIHESVGVFDLTHWGRVTHICVGNLTIIGPDNGLSPGRRQAIIWTNTGILLTGPWGTNFSEISIGIHTFSFKKIRLKMSSAKWRPFCLGLNVVNVHSIMKSTGHDSVQWPSASLRLMTLQFKNIANHTKKQKAVKCIFCSVWFHNIVRNSMKQES